MVSIVSFADRIVSLIAQVQRQYYRLVIVVGPVASGKTRVLQLVSDRTGAPILNANLEVARELLPMTGRQRSVRLPKVMEQIVTAATTAGSLVLLDNTEILFDTALTQDPLRLLQSLSRERTIVSTWGGRVEGRYIVYADPDHPEYRRYPIRDFEVVELEASQ